MKLQEVKEILQANTWVGHDKLDDIEVTHAAATDLMSELLRLDGDGALLLTGLNNIQVIRSSIVSGISGVVFVRGKRPTKEMIRQANTHALPILTSSLSMFTSCGKLYDKGLKSIR